MALLRDNLFVDGLDSFALSTDEALAEPTSDDLLHSYPGTVSIFLCCLIISRQRDFARSFMSSCPIIVRSFFLGLTVGVQISDELVAVFYYGQLLLDINGRTLLAQFNLPGTFYRLERHHHLHHSRMGYVL